MMSELKKSVLTGAGICFLVFFAVVMGKPSSESMSLTQVCNYDFQELDSSTEEFLLPYVNIKLEHGKGIAKMKLKGAFETFEWDYVNVNQNPGSIIAALKRKDSNDVVAQLVAVDKQAGKINWALFYKPVGALSGFYLRGRNGGVSCEPVSIDQWISRLKEFSGGKQFTKKRLVGAPPDSVYEQFGLLGL